MKASLLSSLPLKSQQERSALFDRISPGQLLWLPEVGVGYYPVTDTPYDRGYWERYLRMDETETGKKLSAMRNDLVNGHWQKEVVDVGIGGGGFLKSRENTKGFDVNPCAVDWLKTQDKWLDIRDTQVEAATFWDSLEHMQDPSLILRNVRHWAFISTPIYQDCTHVLRSKHFRRDEHTFYFTHDGLQWFMRVLGFDLVQFDHREETAGREDIGSYAFRRVYA